MCQNDKKDDNAATKKGNDEIKKCFCIGYVFVAVLVAVVITLIVVGSCSCLFTSMNKYLVCTICFAMLCITIITVTCIICSYFEHKNCANMENKTDENNTFIEMCNILFPDKQDGSDEK